MVNRITPKHRPKLRVNHRRLHLQPEKVQAYWLPINSSQQTSRQKTRPKKRQKSPVRKERRPIMKINSRSRTNLDK